MRSFQKGKMISHNESPEKRLLNLLTELIARRWLQKQHQKEPKQHLARENNSSSIINGDQP